MPEDKQSLSWGFRAQNLTNGVVSFIRNTSMQVYKICLKAFLGGQFSLFSGMTSTKLASLIAKDCEKFGTFLERAFLIQYLIYQRKCWLVTGNCRKNSANHENAFSRKSESFRRMASCGVLLVVSQALCKQTTFSRTTFIPITFHLCCGLISEAPSRIL